MKVLKLLIFALLFGSCALWSQQNSKVVPDCVLGSITFNAVGNSNNFDNRPQSNNVGVPCTEWVLAWSAQASVTSVTIQIRGAADSAGTPGTFSSLASSTTFPSGKLFYTSSTGYSPWMQVRLNAAGAAGTVNATLLGWRDDAATIASSSSSSGCPGTSGTPCIVAGPDAPGAAPTKNPVQQGVFDGTDVQRAFISPNENAITLSAGTDVVIVAGTASTTTYVTKFDMSWDNAADVTIRQGTGTTCLTNALALSGAYKNLVALFEDYSNVSALRNTIQARDICLHFSTSVTGGGQAFFTQF